MYLLDKNLLPDVMVEAKPAVFTLPAFAAWLQTKPPDEEYDYGCHGHCLIGQYLKFCGVSFVGVYSDPHYKTTSGERVPYPKIFNEIAMGHPRTFGGANERTHSEMARA